jgi:hypothetical protein
MGTTVIKVNRDEDFYVVWSSITEDPIAFGDREYIVNALYDLDDRKAERIPADQRPEARIERADKLGTSARWPSLTDPAYHWDDGPLIFRQQGLVRRDRLGTLCTLLLVADDHSDIEELLDPFEDDE